MTVIAAEADDSPARLAAKTAAQRSRPGSALDPYFYRSQRVYRRELDEILFKSWLYAGHVSQVPNVGDHFVFDLGEDSIIVVRDGDGEIHALASVCRHRGSRICSEQQGSSQALVCPYHGCGPIRRVCNARPVTAPSASTASGCCEGAEREPIVTFGQRGNASADLQNRFCRACHEDYGRSRWAGSAHERGDVACADCHRTQSPVDGVRTRTGQVERCP